MGKTRETADLTSDTLMTPNIDTDVINVGSSIKLGGASGIITATTFSGALSGTATNATNASGLTGTPDITIGELGASSLLKEGVNITAGKLSDNTNIDLANGMVHLFTTTDVATSTPNIRYDSSNSLNSKMSIGEAITVVLISATAAAAYSAELTIDSSAVTEEWLGGSAPSSGGNGGYDVYTYSIIKTADATFTVLANIVNFA